MLRTIQDYTSYSPEVIGISSEASQKMLSNELAHDILQAISFQEFSENVEKMYATSIFMSSRCCGSGTCD